MEESQTDSENEENNWKLLNTKNEKEEVHSIEKQSTWTSSETTLRGLVPVSFVFTRSKPIGELELLDHVDNRPRRSLLTLLWLSCLGVDRKISFENWETSFFSSKKSFNRNLVCSVVVFTFWLSQGSLPSSFSSSMCSLKVIYQHLLYVEKRNFCIHRHIQSTFTKKKPNVQTISLLHPRKKAVMRKKSW